MGYEAHLVKHFRYKCLRNTNIAPTHYFRMLIHMQQFNQFLSIFFAQQHIQNT